MAASKHGPVRFQLAGKPGLPERIWKEVGSLGSFEWKIGGLSELQDMLSPADYQRVVSAPDSTTQNRVIRAVMSPYITQGSFSDRLRVCTWVVKNWGGIQKGHDAIEDWLRDLKRFDEASVRSFVKQHETKRISSWSKLLSFADATQYPVYDARTAVALNALIWPFGNIGSFSMPGTQNTKIPAAIALVKDGLRARIGPKRIRWAGYVEYIGLLTAVAEVGQTDILDIEMRLFANAVRLAEAFVRQHAPASPPPPVASE